jgi:hypothetical protein
MIKKRERGKRGHNETHVRKILEERFKKWMGMRKSNLLRVGTIKVHYMQA